MDQRGHERYLVELPVQFAGDCVGTAIVYNLRMGGCKIASDAVDYHPNGGLAVEPGYRIRPRVPWHGRIETERLARFLSRLAAAAA